MIMCIYIYICSMYYCDQDALGRLEADVGALEAELSADMHIMY